MTSLCIDIESGRHSYASKDDLSNFRHRLRFQPGQSYVDTMREIHPRFKYYILLKHVFVCISMWYL